MVDVVGFVVMVVSTVRSVVLVVVSAGIPLDEVRVVSPVVKVVAVANTVVTAAVILVLP